MALLEEIKNGKIISGLLPGSSVTVIAVEWIDLNAIELTYKDENNVPKNEIIYRSQQDSLVVLENEKKWSFKANAKEALLASEALRISLAHLFDPMMALNTSQVEPLPHQITAVYEELLTRQPLRYVLADDPGAGKTIMAGLFIAELIARGDLKKCLVVCPGIVADQWQDELYHRFHLTFEILSQDKITSSLSGNPFHELTYVIASIDKLSRDQEIQDLLKHSDWDLIICDEAHKMSASFFGGEVKYTKRYQLGVLLSNITRHFLLMTATPHNGK